MNRIVVSILTIVIYLLAQFLPSIALSTGLLSSDNAVQLAKMSINIQVISFIVAAILIIILQYTIKNPMAFELQPKEEKRYIPIWIIAGLGVVFIAQIVINLLTTLVFGIDPASENTLELMKVARQMPVFIILIAIVGPILEEFVFRKVIFGEIYNAIKSSPAIKFLVASIVSSVIFSLAHMDFTHFLTYFVMGMVFAAFYIYTKRLSVAIGIHMAQNALVTVMQLLIPEKVFEEMLKETSFITFFIHHIIM
ncbi:intramembrane glutamic endopeptidase MroQ [Staphylococcus sp. 11261D007BR]